MFAGKPAPGGTPMMIPGAWTGAPRAPGEGSAGSVGPMIREGVGVVARGGTGAGGEGTSVREGGKGQGVG